MRPLFLKSEITKWKLQLWLLAVLWLKIFSIIWHICSVKQYKKVHFYVYFIKDNSNESVEQLMLFTTWAIQHFGDILLPCHHHSFDLSSLLYPDTLNNTWNASPDTNLSNLHQKQTLMKENWCIFLQKSWVLPACHLKACQTVLSL